MGVAALRGVRERSKSKWGVGHHAANHPEWPEDDLFLLNEPDHQTPDQGMFYSRRRQFVGVWRLTKNVLSLSWDAEEPQDIVRAVESEREWRNDQTGLVLTVVNLEVLPQWLAPSVLSQRYELLSLAERYNECAVCYFELYRLPVGILRSQSKRACSHYFHTECIKRLVAKNAHEARNAGHAAVRECPICRAKFSDIKTLPDVFKDPRAWFQLCDIDCGGTLDKEEVLGALGAVLPVERDKLAEAIEENWVVWDPDNDGSITLTEFVEPRRGLREYLLRNFNVIKTENLNIRPDDIPDLDSHPLEWFNFWDGNGNGSLERSEIVRAIVRTFCVSPSGEPSFKRAFDLREMALFIWDSLGYHEFGELTFEEFNAPFGVGDQIYHNYIHGMYFGENEEHNFACYPRHVACTAEDLIHEIVDGTSREVSREAVRDVAAEHVRKLKEEGSKGTARAHRDVDEGDDDAKSHSNDENMILKELDSTFLNIAILDRLLRGIGDGREGVFAAQILDDVLKGIVADRLLELASGAASRSTLLELSDGISVHDLCREADRIASEVFSCELQKRLSSCS
ncbi:hypothetical protein FOZ61_007303 [Perkinsus olseni]|uniref:RING-type domain-containing protein n=1 Tax=Perkinsus olseni TaxID=32597 RepID=A0A7J6M912_PEROL|nr:hypothetical protein FOZ61_007303 [Perkinsus olseni]